MRRLFYSPRFALIIFLAFGAGLASHHSRKLANFFSKGMILCRSLLAGNFRESRWVTYAFYRLNSYDREKKILYYLPPEKRIDGKRVFVKKLFHRALRKQLDNARQIDLFFRAKSLKVIYIFLFRKIYSTYMYRRKYIVHIKRYKDNMQSRAG